MRFSKEYFKLSKNTFTTIRQNKGYYAVDQIITIKSPEQEFKAKILRIDLIKKEEINQEKK